MPHRDWLLRGSLAPQFLISARPCYLSVQHQNFSASLHQLLKTGFAPLKPLKHGVEVVFRWQSCPAARCFCFLESHSPHGRDRQKKGVNGRISRAVTLSSTAVPKERGDQGCSRKKLAMGLLIKDADEDRKKPREKCRYGNEIQQSMSFDKLPVFSQHTKKTLPP